jgi:hypothetical protein
MKESKFWHYQLSTIRYQLFLTISVDFCCGEQCLLSSRREELTQISLTLTGFGRLSNTLHTANA